MPFSSKLVVVDLCWSVVVDGITETVRFCIANTADATDAADAAVNVSLDDVDGTDGTSETVRFCIANTADATDVSLDVDGGDGISEMVKSVTSSKDNVMAVAVATSTVDRTGIIIDEGEETPAVAVLLSEVIAADSTVNGVPELEIE